MNAKPIILTKKHAKRVLEVVDAGLCSGVGIPEPGNMCVEAAVCYALGLPHGDNPVCVGEAVRRYKITLNDAAWPSNAARAEGLREIAIAQLGSNEIDQKAFASGVVLRTIKVILPIALRAVASVIPGHKEALEIAAVACEAAIDLVSAASAAESAAWSAASAASAARSAAWSAASAAWSAEVRVSILRKAADIGVEVLKELGCKGTKWLALTRESPSRALASHKK